MLRIAIYSALRLHQSRSGLYRPVTGFSTVLSHTTTEAYAYDRLLESRCPHQLYTPGNLFNCVAFCYGASSPVNHLILLPSERSGAANYAVRGCTASPWHLRSHLSWCAICSDCVRKNREWSSLKLGRAVCAIISNIDTSSHFRLCGPS